jgi:hypothetical protein
LDVVSGSLILQRRQALVELAGPIFQFYSVSKVTDKPSAWNTVTASAWVSSLVAPPLFEKLDQINGQYAMTARFSSIMRDFAALLQSV